MLNGRVYGAKNRRKNNKNVNHFANISDKEPEFVEWGYGGMGSVSGGRHAGVIGDHEKKGRPRWERLHGQATGEAVGGEDDDGSTNAWLKKRKEKREREQAEKEKADQAPSQPCPDALTSLPSDTVPDPPVDPPFAPTTAVVTDTALDHDSTTITLPPLSPRHQRPEGGVPTNRSLVSLVSPSSPQRPTFRPSSEDSEHGSDSGYSEETYEEDEEDEEQRKAVRRKTALGAGVEKIRRHNS